MLVNEVRSMLARNRMFINDQGAVERGKALIKKATEIIDDRRNSKMTDETASNIFETIQAYSTKNEKTLLVNLWQLLINDTRFCKKKLASGDEECLSPAEEVEVAEWIKKAWFKDDQLWTKWDAEFFTGTLPEIVKTGDAAWDAVLASVSRVAKPIPDLRVGFDPKAFTDAAREVLDQFGCKLTVEQYISFFELEAKGSDGSISEATNQCCRGGAAMARNCRDFYKATNAFLSVSPTNAGSSSSGPTQAGYALNPSPATPDQQYPRPDMTSFTFSIALTAELVILFVHWAEETGVNAEVWQQNKVRTYKLDCRDDTKLLRCNIDNIYDWGIAIRKKEIVAQCERYLEHLVKLNATEETTASKRAKEAVESGTIKRQKLTNEGKSV
ncbi:MAG: hypothetical protein Q9219_007404 [cf. Caloplaca sp. 3 TL-2023]